MPRRTHSKISELPEALRKAVEGLCLKGQSYDEITAFLTEKGATIGRSSVGRWGKDFSRRLEQLALASRQAEAIAKTVGDRPGTEQAEATTRLAQDAIFNRLLELQPDDWDEVKTEDLLYAAASLEKSTVARERLKLIWMKEMDAKLERDKKKAAEEIGEIAEAGGLDADKIAEIQAKVFGIKAKAEGQG
jgi:hypothetical protein